MFYHASLSVLGVIVTHYLFQKVTELVTELLYNMSNWLPGKVTIFVTVKRNRSMSKNLDFSEQFPPGRNVLNASKALIYFQLNFNLLGCKGCGTSAEYYSKPYM